MGAARVPTFVVSHNVPEDIPDGSVYRFVNGVEAALEKAKEVAGDNEISISGANVAKQLITFGLLDEVSIHLVPILFGSGTPLFGDLDSRHISLEPIEVIQSAEVIHLRFRVVK